MADMKIKRHVSMGTRTYGPGDEKELSKVLTAEQAKRLKDRGSIAGDWGKGGDESDEDKLPAVKDLADHLATMDSADAVRAMQERDDRKSAGAIYEARLAELEQ